MVHHIVHGPQHSCRGMGQEGGARWLRPHRAVGTAAALQIRGGSQS
uniref:Uncharacterized protein n=1 Tax=Arundo donax TaxID=35708 RepID=A0A0A9A1Y5_ARUDO